MAGPSPSNGTLMVSNLVNEPIMAFMVNGTVPWPARYCLTFRGLACTKLSRSCMVFHGASGRVTNKMVLAMAAMLTDVCAET